MYANEIFMLSRSKSQIRFRNRLTSLVALLFVLYAIADVSVLQAYCGNEALGIPPAHHVSESPNSTSHADQANYFISADHHQQQSDDEHDYDHQHECFCWHQTVVGSYFLTQREDAFDSSSRLPAFRSSGHKNSDLDRNLRPPQIL